MSPRQVEITPCVTFTDMFCMAPTYRIAQFRGPKFLQISRITGHCEIIPMKILTRAVHLHMWTVFQRTHATASSMALFAHINSEDGQ